MKIYGHMNICEHMNIYEWIYEYIYEVEEVEESILKN